jgi:hypothetical protein
MKPHFPNYFGRSVAVAGILLGLAGRAAGQDTTQWLALKPPVVFAEMDVESETISETLGNTHYTSDRLYLAPTLGLDLGGSIYHPNLLQFDLKGQGGYIEQNLTTRGEGENFTTRQTSYLQNYDANVLLLANKPYAAGFTATRTHTFEDIDIFNQATVDGQSYGGHMGYDAGPVPFTIAAQHTEENETGMQYNNVYKQDDLLLSAQNNRKIGDTTFSYDLGQYNQQASDVSQCEFYQYGTLLDTEKFGPGNHLESSVNFNEEDSQSVVTNTTRNVIIQEALALQHSQNWDSFYNYNYYNAYADPAESETHSGSIGLHNQLFESLSSTWDVHGSLQDASGGGGSSSDSMYGFGNTETYTKELSDWGHLTIGNTVRYDLQQENNSGAPSTIFNEPHKLKDGAPTFLNQPLVISVDKVTDPTGTKVYIKGIDYTYFAAGDLTQLERVPTSLNLTNNSAVLVNYTVQAQPSGSYNTSTEQFQVRLDLFQGLVSVHSEIDTVENHSDQDFILENSTDTLSGADVRWNWLQAGGAYETEHANLISYTALSAYQSASFKPSETATLSLNGNERWAHYPMENMSVDDYTLTTRLSDQLGQRLQISVEGGVWNEQGGPLAQTLLTAGTHLRYTVGKLLFSLTYQFNQQQIVSGTNLRNFVSFTLRRNF